MKNFFLLSILVIFFACEDNKDELHSEDIIPLEVGLEWTYVDSILREDTIIVDTSKFGITQKKEFLFKGESVELFYWTSFDFRINEFNNYSLLCKNDNDGFSYYGGISGNDDYIFGKYLQYKFPVNINDSWPKRIFYGTYRNGKFVWEMGDYIEVFCISINDTFYTPIYNFECYTYHTIEYSNGNINTTYTYCAPDIGLIGTFGERDGKKLYSKTLISYTH